MTRKFKQTGAVDNSDPSVQRKGWITDLEMWQSTLDQPEDADIDFSLINDNESSAAPTPDAVGHSSEINRVARKPDSTETHSRGENASGKRVNVPPTTAPAVKARHTTAETPVPRGSRRSNMRQPNSVDEASTDSRTATNKPRRNLAPSSQVSQPHVNVSRTDKVMSTPTLELSPAGACITDAGYAAIPCRTENSSQQTADLSQTWREQDMVKSPAVFGAKNPDGNINVQNVSAVMKQLKRDKYGKLAKAFVGYVLAHWFVFSTALLSFGVGYYVGAINNKHKESSTFNARVEKNNAVLDTSVSIDRSPTVSKPVAPKRSKPKPVMTKPARRESPGLAEGVAVGDVNEQANIPDRQIQLDAVDSRQFAGKDIPIMEATDDLAEGVMPLVPASEEPAASPSQETPLAMVSGTDAAASTLANVGAVSDMPGEMPEALPVATAAEPDNMTLEALLNENFQEFDNKAWESVITSSNKIISLAPQSTAALINRSVAYTELGMFSLAIADANRVIDIEPENALAFNNRGYAYEKMADFVKAAGDYQTACNLGIALSCKEVERLQAEHFPPQE